VVTKVSVAVWESSEARETMVMSMSSLESTLKADSMILMSSLPWVPGTKGSRWTWTPSAVERFQSRVWPVHVLPLSRGLS
jgi:hypothetical protein